MYKAHFILVTALTLAAQAPSGDYYQAIGNNDLAAVRRLSRSSDLNARDARGGTPLMYAAFVGSPEALKVLLEAGAEVNAKDAFDVTPLMLAASDPAKVRLLLGKGADVNARSKMGRTALLIAASEDGNSESVRLLVDKGADVKVAEESGMNALVAATTVNDADSVRLLLAKGADANSHDRYGNSALMYAASFGNVAAMKLLIAKGADVNAVTSKETEPPLKNGPIDIGNLTPLLLATTYGGLDAVKLLVDAGAKVNVQDLRGMTPLIFATSSDRPDPRVVRFLLEKGADTGIKSRNGESAADWAKKFNHPGVMDALGLQQPERAQATLVRADDRAPLSRREAVAKSIALLQRTSDSFFKEGGCVGCHAQNLTGMAVHVARTNGIAVDERAASEQLKATHLQWVGLEPLLRQGVDPPGGQVMIEYSLLPMSWEHIPGDRATDAMLHTLAREQRRDGSWHDGGIARPPIQDGQFAGTALAIGAFRNYGFAGRKAEFDERTARAAAWLRKAEPRTTEDRNMQLLGLHWAGEDGPLPDRLRREILAAQREDGGWAQTPGLASDAYATGQTLFALHATGVPTSDAAYRRGADYLLNTQVADGSWHVISRAARIQPYFQSGFPHDHDQWISSMGTAWAAIALSYGGEEKQVAARVP